MEHLSRGAFQRPAHQHHLAASTARTFGSGPIAQCEGHLAPLVPVSVILVAKRNSSGTHVRGVGISPLFLALAALYSVGRIVHEFLAVISRAPAALAVFHTTDHLIRAISGRLEALVAIG